jgi:hypothetical protein
MADLTTQLQAAAGAAGEATDPNFNQTVLLLHGDGTNGAQNNTFLDSSTNNFTITRNGNTTQGTFTPFSLPNGQWSNYLNAPTSADGLDFPSNVALQPGTSDFCVEFWVYMNSVSSDVTFISRGNLGSFFDLLIQFRPSVGNNLRVNTTPNSYVPYDFSWTPSANVWYHIAVTRSGTNLRAFVNGTQIGTTQSDSQNMNQSVNFAVGYNRQAGGQNLGGYISNVRFVKGSAVYTSAFTSPTAPLTAISGTELLTCQSNRFVDNSSNNFAATVVGSIRVQPFSPFLPTAEYDASVNGGSGYFDGSGDKLVLPDNAAFAQNTDFTLEGWMYPLDNSANMFLYYMLANGSLAVGYYTDKKVKVDAPFVGIQITSSGTFDPNQWLHIAMSRISGTTTLYVNGVSQGTTGFTTTSTTNASNDVGVFTKGYISDYRYIKGTGIYTGAFTPPTAPLTAITNTQALLNFTNAGIFDNTGKNNLETVGNAQIDTTTKKYGTGSIEFDGTGDYLVLPNSPNTQVGAGPYTIEMWINTTQAWGWLVFDADNDTGIRLGINVNGTQGGGADGLVRLEEQIANVGYSISSTTRVDDGNWHHVAISRSAGTPTKLFIDGVLEATNSIVVNLTNPNRMFIGTRGNLAYFFNGYIDDLRITKGIARYTANFTPPSAPFEDQ